MTMKLGERLVKDFMVDAEQINQALLLQSQTGGQLGDILLAITSMRSLDFYQVLAKHYQLAFVNLLTVPIDGHLLSDADKQLYLDRQTLPIQKEGNQLIVATANPSPGIFQFIKEHWGENTRVVCTSKFDILFALQKHFRKNYLNEAINGLILNNASQSSKYTLSKWQLLLLFFASGLALFFAVAKPLPFLTGVNVFLMVSVFGVLFYKIILSLIAYLIYVDRKPPAPTALADDKLPIYTILIPLYHENRTTLRHLFASMGKLAYPKHRLDIKILIEEDDLKTTEVLKQLKLPSNYEFIYIPKSHPRTKAKACNYGLRFARGEYLTLYDAEDQPDPNQLRVALAVFAEHHTERLGCVQSRLNFYNSHENWLTKMFAIEYSYWFDLLLPALEYLGTPIPLGGTSNHFKTAILREIYAWDPYNVTEDADLGTRLDRLGYKTRVLASTTYEEATCRLLNWIRQRTRWIKGYIQTYIVHMRTPFQLWRTVGTSGFLGFQLFIGGTVLTNLANLLLWLVFILSCCSSLMNLDFLFPKQLFFLSALNFVLGSVGVIALNILGVIRRKEYKLILVAFTAPLYWLLMSIASYRALYQIIVKPSYWEKTEHGVSKTLQ